MILRPEQCTVAVTLLKHINAPRSGFLRDNVSSRFVKYFRDAGTYNEDLLILEQVATTRGFIAIDLYNKTFCTRHNNCSSSVNNLDPKEVSASKPMLRYSCCARITRITT
jgi:hypothetical protein